MSVQFNTTTREEIAKTLNDAEPAMRYAAHDEDRPFMPLLPTLKAFALLNTEWQMFRKAYIKAVDKAAGMGYGFAVIE